MIYVFEDLHWADPAMLAFIEHLADWSEGVPMLLVGTARPELSERHPNWGAGLRNASTMNLAPLSEEETARLIGELLGQVALPAEVQAPILERAGGNPLYAEEFVRMLKDRELLVQRGRTWELVAGADIPFPEGVQGLIAARLDSLPGERKALLQDAAVIGKVFWAGALAAMSDVDERSIRETLHELSRKELVRPSRQSSMEGESEYGFWHMLVRDVVYSQIPRAARAGKHVAAAEWLEAQAGERAEDLADVLAHHYAEAIELGRIAGTDTGDLRDRALRFIMLAGERASHLDPSMAQALYEQALELAADAHPSRPEILFALAEIHFVVNRFSRAKELLEEAIAGFQHGGRTARAAEAKLLLVQVLGYLERSGDLLVILDQAIAELEALPPGQELVRAYAARAKLIYVADDDVGTIEWADKSLDLAERHGLPPEIAALRVRGASRWFTGDPGGLEDLRLSISLAQQRGLVREVAMGHNELSNVLAVSSGPAEALRVLEAGVDVALRSGHPVVAMDLQTFSRQEFLYDLGRWEELLSESSAFAAPDRDDVAMQARMTCRIMICDAATWRGDLGAAGQAGDGLYEALIEAAEPQSVLSGSDVVAHLSLARGDVARAAELLHELEAFPNIRDAWNYAAYLPELVRLALDAIGIDFATKLTQGIPDYPTKLNDVSFAMVEAELAEAHGELESAADLYDSAEEGWRTFSVPERAQALLGRGRCLLELGDPEGESVLRESREVFASLKANRFLPEVDGLLERALRLTS